MNLYMISQDVNDNYDTYDGAVVAADNPLSAQAMHPSGFNKDFTFSNYEWCNIQDVKVELIGKAKSGTKAGVILASFKAG